MRDRWAVITHPDGLVGGEALEPAGHRELIGTKAGEAKIRGKRIGNAMTWAVSLLDATSPMTANPHSSA